MDWMLSSRRIQRIRKGTIIGSFLLFPVSMNYFSTYPIIEGAIVGVMNGSLIGFTQLFIISLFLGRGFVVVLFAYWLFISWTFRIG
ncbi:MAG: hypothetical protein ACFFEE_00645 [Candidatus Thorarchaeota archaeon]